MSSQCGSVTLPSIAPITAIRQRRIHSYLRQKSIASDKQFGVDAHRKSFFVNLSIVVGCVDEHLPRSSRDKDRDVSGQTKTGTTQSDGSSITLPPLKRPAKTARQQPVSRRVLRGPVMFSPNVVNVARYVDETLLTSGERGRRAKVPERLFRLTSYWMHRFGSCWQLARDTCCRLVKLYDDGRAWRELRLLTTLADRDMDKEAPTGKRERLFWRVYGTELWRRAERLEATVNYMERCHAEGIQPTDLPSITCPSGVGVEHNNSCEDFDHDFDDTCNGGDGGIDYGSLKEAGYSCFVSGDLSPKLLRLPPIARVDKPSCDQLLLPPIARKATFHTNCDRHCSGPPIIATPLTARSFHRNYTSKMFHRKTPLPPRCTPDEEYVRQTIYGDMVNTDDDRITPRCFHSLESLLR